MLANKFASNFYILNSAVSKEKHHYIFTQVPRGQAGPPPAAARRPGRTRFKQRPRVRPAAEPGPAPGPEPAANH